MFNRCKLQRLVIEGDHEKDEDSNQVNEEERNYDKMLEEGANTNNPLTLRKDSSMTTNRGRTKNRQTQQTNQITRYYKFRGKT